MQLSSDGLPGWVLVDRVRSDFARESLDGYLVWNFIRERDSELDKQRVGALLYGKNRSSLAAPLASDQGAACQARQDRQDAPGARRLPGQRSIKRVGGCVSAFLYNSLNQPHVQGPWACEATVEVPHQEAEMRVASLYK